MTDLRILIADDEPLARQRLRRMLGKDPGIEIVGDYGDGPSTLQAAREKGPDLLLLDIQMPGIDGFGIVEQLAPGLLPTVVFVTAFDEHAIHAFETCALDYLLKPVSPERLAKTIARVRKHLAMVKADPPSREEEKTAPISPKFLVRCGQRTCLISPDEIDWVEAEGNYAILHAAGKNHLLRATMATLEARLPATFLRASRFAILNLHRIREIQSIGGNHFAIMRDGARVTLTRSIREIEERWRSV